MKPSRLCFGTALKLVSWLPLCVSLLVFSFQNYLAADERSEVKRLAPKYGAEIEVRLWDGTRVDLLNDRYAIEVDWDRKWSEAIGQALFYGIMTDKRPGIILLRKDKKETKYAHRCQIVCSRFGIRLWIEDVEAASDDNQ